MPTPHINAEAGDFANVVLMPGDPLRAKWMAETYLHDVKLVTNVRNIFGYTGYTKNGKKISIMASGMGQPSIGIYSHELFSQYNVDVIIRVGTCGGYVQKVNLYDVIIASAASTDSNWQVQYGVSGSLSASPDFDLLETAVNIARKKNVPLHIGNVLSSDIFYNANIDGWKKWADIGVIAVEMESYALYCNAQKFNKKALCILTCSDSFLVKGILTPEERQSGLARMIEIGIETAEKFAK